MKKIFILTPISLFFLFATLEAAAQNSNDQSANKPSNSLDDKTKLESIKGDPSGIKVESGTAPLPVMKGQPAVKQSETVSATPSPAMDKPEEFKIMVISEDSKTGLRPKNIDRPKGSTIRAEKQPEGPQPPTPVVLRPKD